MEVSTSLLVALMFVTLLSMGIGNAVNAFSTIVEKGKDSGYGKLQIAWLGLLLLSYFNMFWHVIDLLSVNKWGFPGFLYMMSGPILIYFATSIIIASKSEDKTNKTPLKPRFFAVFALFQGWIITVDYMLGKSILENSMLNIVMILIALVLMRKPDETIHRYGLIASWGVVGLAVVLRGLGVLG
ncbi:MAG: hypothetical protein WBF77_12940 [Sulfurimonadaceae bacterium]